MPEWFREYLEQLPSDRKAQLGEYILTTDDNEVTTEIIDSIEQVA